MFFSKKNKDNNDYHSSENQIKRLKESLDETDRQMIKRNNELSALYDHFDVEYVEEEVRKSTDFEDGFIIWGEPAAKGFVRKRKKKKEEKS